MNQVVDVEFKHHAPQIDSGVSHYDMHRTIAGFEELPEERRLFAMVWKDFSSMSTVRVRMNPDRVSYLAAALDQPLTPIAPPDLSKDSTFRFVITVNPVVRQREGERRISRRSPDIDAAGDWMLSRLEAGGFEVLDLSGSFLRDLRVKKQKDVVVLQRARFAGELRVIDPEKAAHVFHQGIGRGRGFGLGMLILFR